MKKTCLLLLMLCLLIPCIALADSWICPTCQV